VNPGTKLALSAKALKLTDHISSNVSRKIPIGLREFLPDNGRCVHFDGVVEIFP
jgi:hypothetical protein